MSNTQRRVDWLNLVFMVSAHLLALAAILWTGWVHFSWWTVGLAFLYFAFCGVSITGGYHRLFSHPTYRARPLLELFYLIFGAASVQNSALKWSSDHRLHHREVDRDADPYNIKRGFFWAHMGWVCFKDRGLDLSNVPDLAANPRVQWQHKHYVRLAVLIGVVLPLALGFLWRDPIGALLLAGFLRLVVQYHATFAVNSFAHYIGTQPYSDKSSARDSALTAVLTLGEGYHNFHHHFQSDYRNGVRWFQLDPTKWFVWTLSRFGITSDLKRTSDEKIRAARAAMRARPAAR